MNEEQVKKTLERLAYYAVRNELLAKRLSQLLGVSIEDTSATEHEIDKELQSEDTVQRRFRELFPD